jgi:hypothetical protein
MAYTIQGRRFYIPLRGLASVVSLLLAVWYSHDLGVVNRSYLAVIMVACSLSIIAFTSGTTLTLRAYKSYQIVKSLRTSFSSCIILELIFSISFFVFSLVVFSIVKEPIPTNLVLIANVYFVCAFFHTVLVEYLLANDKFHTAAKLEFFTVLLQVMLFFLLNGYSSLSTASSVLISFAVSYFSICCFIVYKSPSSGFIGFSNPRNFWDLTKGKHLFGTVIGVLDRLDRVLVAFLLPTINLGQYATMGSLLSFFRFLPEAFSKIVVSGPIETKFKSTFSKITTIACSTILVLVVILISRIFIEAILGSEWLLSIPIYISFALYEIVRGFFHVRYNSCVAKLSTPSSWTLTNLFFICLVLAFILSNVMGLIGIPLAFGIGYLGAYTALRIEKRI